jgi:5-methyltetrahydrofolate--homocysteine methyltransferase
MTEMKKVITLAKENDLNVSIIIGGAVITADYATEIGAAGYAKDAAGAVRLVQRLMAEGKC